jgi:hypothetical protein
MICFLENVNVEKGSHIVKIELSFGRHEIKLIFKKEESSTSVGGNPLKINWIDIYGSNEGGALNCVKCKKVDKIYYM